MKLKWLDEAFFDLLQLRNYIALDKPSAAQKISQKILKSINHLTDHPEMGRLGRIQNTRELVISGTPYFAVYRIKKEMIEVLRVLHGAMEWPD